MFEGLAAAGEFANDGIDGCGPDKGFGIFVPGDEEVVDGGDKFIDAEEGIATDALLVSSANHRSIRFNQLQLVGT